MQSADFTIKQRTQDRLAGTLVIASAALSALLVLRITDRPAIAVGFVATIMSVAALLLLYRRLAVPETRVTTRVDWSLVRAVADNDGVALAITGRGGHLVCTNTLYDRLFGSSTPPELSVAGDIEGLRMAGLAAWRDGSASGPDIRRESASFATEAMRVGTAEDHLLWRFRVIGSVDAAAQAIGAIGGEWGDRLGEAGIMMAIIGGEGRVRAANRPLVTRATGRADAPIAGRDFVTLLSSDKLGTIRFREEDPDGMPLRLLQIPLEQGDEGGRLIVLLDDDGVRAGLPGTDGVLQTLLAMLPLGLALADRDGRFLYINPAFMRASGIAPGSTPVYPGDLVVREDKAIVADAVRRFALGHGGSSDFVVHLNNNPDDPIALTIAGARGLGEAAVLLSLNDNTEESRLKREVAQAIKMQAVGQLAGGVAHDFNNILTAIIGHCDLMLMRHTPGDSDYDDIQQVRINSNRAAGLTRQLLAFSRQQTLRPQTLQLPDVISEVSNLLQRLLGETVALVIKHGRSLGPVRADPGQLEQVIVNLAVNARDAMPDGGTLTLQTYAVTAGDVRKLGSDILPIADYTALSLTDTGTGIAPEIVSKIFEPFFTTKEVGKGTGLGLSTVYGIVKQSNGFIFCDSKLGEGTSFVIYLPVTTAIPDRIEATKTPEKPADLWGSGTVLVVEDEDMVRVVAERALTRHGYTVLTASNGEEALETLRGDEHIDLLISDVVMPTMDGPTLVRHARKLFPDLPILFMSGYAEEQLRRTIDIDRIAFLPKPFSVKQLAEAARDALN